MEILEDNVWSVSPWQSALSDQSYTSVAEYSVWPVLY